jgi:acetyl esterase
MRRILAMAVAVTAAAAVVVGATPAWAGGVKVTRNVQYTVDGGQPQYLDAYLPGKTGSRRPAVIFVHGGGWNSGDKSRWASDASSLASMGWVAFTINYRLDSASPYGSEPADVRAAVEWVQRNATAYGVSGARIGIVGDSAGGHLAVLQATTGSGSPGNAGRVKAAVSWSGPMDMPLLPTDAGCASSPCDHDTQYIGWAAQAFEAGCYAATCPDARWQTTSPVAQVDATDPATLLVNSTRELIPLDQLEEMRSALQSAGVPVRTRVFDGSAHAYGYHDAEWQETVSFLQQTL